MAAPKKPASKPKTVPTHPLMIDGQRWNQQAVLDIVCERIASSHKGVYRILKDGWEGNKLPSYVAFKEWLTKDESLATQYARAKEDQADFLADDLVEIADEPPTTDGETGKIDSGWVAWQRMRVDVRKWAASKLKPKKYGDRVTNEHTGENGNPIQSSITVTFVDPK